VLTINSGANIIVAVQPCRIKLETLKAASELRYRRMTKSLWPEKVFNYSKRPEAQSFYLFLFPHMKCVFKCELRSGLWISLQKLMNNHAFMVNN
jgi:hypothetical protein